MATEEQILAAFAPKYAKVRVVRDPEDPDFKYMVDRGHDMEGMLVVAAISRERHPKHGPARVFMPVPVALFDDPDYDAATELLAEMDESVRLMMKSA